MKPIDGDKAQAVLMKATLISINKPHTDNIFSGNKGLEWRKKQLPEGLYYVYETKNKGGCGMVIGEMRITGSKAVDTSRPLEVWVVNAGCVHPVTLKKYANNGIVYANFIQNAKRYDNPLPLSAFRRPCINELYCESCGMYSENIGACGNVALQLMRPPQSWCYVEVR